MGKIVNLATLDELREMCAEPEEAETDAEEIQDEPLTPDGLKKILASLQAKCVKREYCTSDLRRKALKAVGGDYKLADTLMESLINDRFVDNARYAAAFAREKSALTGWGPAKIRTALQLKGISREDISAGLAEVDGDAAAQKMEKVLTAKWRFLREDEYGKFKLIKYGLSRGYDYDAVASCVEAIISETED